MKYPLSTLALGAALLSSSASAQTGPDITVLKIGGTSGSDITRWDPPANGIHGYSFGTTSCNPGTEVVIWTNQDHPVISQNFYRLKDGRFEHIGQSWLKHGFCAVNESGCGSCQGTSCDTLGLGCADTYGSGLNDGKFGDPKFMVNGNSGFHVETGQGPAGNGNIRGRLQVKNEDIDPALNVGAMWFAESQYVSAHEYQAGNSRNSVSYRRLQVNSPSNIDSIGGTVIGDGAPHAWKSVDSAVTVREVTNLNEGGMGTHGTGIHGHFLVGYKTTSLGGGVWRYNYIVENLTSDQAGGSWSVPMPAGVVVSNVYFNDVDYHSGEIQDGTDWATSQANGAFTWSVTPSGDGNLDSDNALRWSTTYSFGFDATASPVNVQGTLGLYHAGVGSNLLVDIEAPSGNSTVTGTIFCAGDGSGTACPCNNHGSTNHGCQNSSGFGAGLTASGDASVSNDTLVLNATQTLGGQPGLFFQGTTAINGGNGIAFGDGLRCAGGAVIRLEVVFPDGQGNASSTSSVSIGGAANAGDTMRYQFWYRDPTFSPCLNGFNLSNGLEIDWTL